MKKSKKVSLSDIKHTISEPDESQGAQALKSKQIQAEAFKRLRDGISLKQCVVEIAQLNNGDLIVGDLDSLVEQLYVHNKDLFNLDNLPVIDKIERFLKARYDLRYNVVANQIECRPKGKGAFEQANENSLWRDLQKNFIDTPPAKLMSILRSDFVPLFDPFESYFANLPAWDGVDYIDMLSGYVRVKEKDKKRFRTNLKKMFVRMVACALDEKIFNKQCMVLVHEKQNSGKTSFCNWLCPTDLEFYSKVDFTVGDKDGKISLCQNFIINLDELASLSKADINQLKSIFTLTHAKERLPYGHTPIRIPRRASFVGSTNNPEFLNDETGSVRWLCFEIESIDFAYRQDCDIDKIYAQAYALWKGGFDFNLNPQDIELNEEANQAFQVMTNERELVAKYFYHGSNESKVFKMNVELLDFLIEKTFNRVRITPKALGSALKLAGFKRASYGVKRTLGYWVSFTEVPDEQIKMDYEAKPKPIATPRRLDDSPPF